MVPPFPRWFALSESLGETCILTILLLWLCWVTQFVSFEIFPSAPRIVLLDLPSFIQTLSSTFFVSCWRVERSCGLSEEHMGTLLVYASSSSHSWVRLPSRLPYTVALRPRNSRWILVSQATLEMSPSLPREVWRLVVSQLEHFPMQSIQQIQIHCSRQQSLCIFEAVFASISVRIAFEICGSHWRNDLAPWDITFVDWQVQHATTFS